MRASSPFCATAICAVLVIATPVHAQEAAPAPGHISYVEGNVTIDRESGTELAVLNMPVVQGDRLRTTTGRAEVMFPDGSAIEIDPQSEVEFVTATRARVVAGAIEHRAPGVDTAMPGVRPSPQGYREYQGSPETSTSYLPPNLQTYRADLDQSGTWQYDASYGNVWYPSVAADWRPYYDGYWAPVPTYGWTWIGYDRWSWPTHHYGRWGFARSRWFWIPGPTFAAAWVSWGTAPGYVSWCPLGYDGRPVVALSIGYRSAWNAWTILPRERFGGRGYPVARYAIEPYRLAASTPFIVHRGAPALNAARSVPVMGRAAGSVAGSPALTRPGFADRRAPASPAVAVPRSAAANSYQRSVPSYQQRAAPSYQRAAPSYQQRAAPSYQRVAPSYQAPRAPRYQPSVPTYQQRAPSYQRPAPSYQRPAPSYQQHAPGFQQRAPSYQQRAPTMTPPSGGSHGGSAPRGGGGHGGSSRGTEAQRRR
jgi:hypothetical protein